MELDTALRLLEFSGCWRPTKLTSWISKLTFLRLIIVHVVILLVFLFYAVSYWTEKELHPKFYYSLLRAFLIFIRTHITMHFTSKEKEQIENLVHNVTDGFPIFNALDEFSTREKAMRKKSKLTLDLYGKFVFSFWTALLWMLVIFGRVLISFLVSDENQFMGENVPYLLRNRRYPLFFEMWSPTDVFQQPTYYIAFFMQVVTLFQLVWNMISMDIFICSVVTAVTHRIELLAETASFALVPSQMTPKLTVPFEQWLDYRNHMKRSIKEINKLLGGMVYVALTTYAFFLTSVTFAWLTISDGRSEWTFILLIGCLLVQFFIFCLVGQGVLSASKKMAFAVHQTVRAQLKNGGYQDGNMSDFICIVVNETAEQKAPFIDARGCYRLSLFYFAKILWSCYGYVNTLLQWKAAN